MKATMDGERDKPATAGESRARFGDLGLKLKELRLQPQELEARRPSSLT